MSTYLAYLNRDGNGVVGELEFSLLCRHSSTSKEIRQGENTQVFVENEASDMEHSDYEMMMHVWCRISAKQIDCYQVQMTGARAKHFYGVEGSLFKPGSRTHNSRNNNNENNDNNDNQQNRLDKLRLRAFYIY